MATVNADLGGSFGSASIVGRKTLPECTIALPHRRHRHPRPQSPAIMSIRIVRLGSPRTPEEGLRLGTVRRPPRGVPKSEFARQDWYDLWFPNLAPSLETMKIGQSAASAADWSAFAKRYLAEMAQPHARHDIALLAVLSHRTHFSLGCYCEDENRCHRSLLRRLLADNGAEIA
jgi:uncharacterized protein YeaO (DUF488 family)